VLEDWAATTLETSRRTGSRAPKTCNDYANTIRLHLVPRLGGIKLAQLRKSDVDRMVGAMLAAGYKPNSVRIARTVLGVVMRDAVRNGLLAANPVMDAEPVRIKKEKRADTVFTAEEVGTILAAAKGDRLEALAAVILGTGLRRGEALGLRWDDIDLDARTLRVDESLQWIEGQGLVFGAPKTATSMRPVTVPGFVAEALRRHRARQANEQVALGPDWADRTLVFATAIGTPLNPSNVTRWWKTLLERAGVPHRRIHDGRHSVATALLNSGESIPNVSQHLGHSRESITVDVYGHASRDAGTRAAAALDAWVRSARRQDVTEADPG
jgi:integrase